jgi:hypothetical protein
MHEVDNILQCAQCDGLFTPMGGKYEPPARLTIPEREPVHEFAHDVTLAPDAVVSEPSDSPILQKASQFLSADETIWALVPGQTLEKTTEIETKGRSSGFGFGLSPISGLGIGVGSGSTSSHSKVKHSMERHGGVLTHYLLVTDWQLIFWMRGIFSEWFGSGPEADQLELAFLRSIEQKQRFSRTILTFHFESGDRFFATPSHWAEKLLPILRALIRKSRA